MLALVSLENPSIYKSTRDSGKHRNYQSLILGENLSEKPGTSAKAMGLHHAILCLTPGLKGAASKLFFCLFMGYWVVLDPV
jgi:hypothetical protein